MTQQYGKEMINVRVRDVECVGYYTGKTLSFLSLALLVPIIVALIYNETGLIMSFIIPSILSGITGLILCRRFHECNMNMKVAMLFSSTIWIVVCLFGALPFILSGQLHFIDAFFEAMSGFTTTGFTMFTNLDVVPYTLQFWRGFTQWIGGLGIVYFLLMLINVSGLNSRLLYTAEGREDRVSPSIHHTVQKVGVIYVILTVLGFIALLAAGMPVFDSVFYVFTALSTGGFALGGLSILQYNSWTIELVTMVIMLLGATNFALIYVSAKRGIRAYFEDVETRLTFAVIAIATIAITAYMGFDSFRLVVYQVVSAITTTGLQTSFFPGTLESFGAFGLMVLTLVMIIGASSGSTGGGLKAIRVVTTIKAMYYELKAMTLPESAMFRKSIRHLGTRVNLSDKYVKFTLTFIGLYIMVYIASVLITLTYYNDLPRAMFEVASACSNVGLGSSICVPSSPEYIKILFTIDFWLGRLEIWPVLISVIYIIRRRG